MSPTEIIATLALLASGLPLLLLARRDPKRLRSTPASPLAPYGLRTRQLLATVVLLPGLVLSGLGYWPAFLIWLGGTTVSGWVFAQWLARRH